jgi:hypothetical protein
MEEGLLVHELVGLDDEDNVVPVDDLSQCGNHMYSPSLWYLKAGRILNSEASEGRSSRVIL